METFKVLIQLFNTVIVWLLGLLPESPLRDVIDTINGFTFLGYLNYFVPFDFCLELFTSWLGAVLSYLTFTVIKDRFDKWLNSGDDGD